MYIFDVNNLKFGKRQNPELVFSLQIWWAHFLDPSHKIMMKNNFPALIFFFSFFSEIVGSQTCLQQGGLNNWRTESNLVWRLGIRPGAKRWQTKEGEKKMSEV
jgi:hypothetical protein